MRFNVVRSISMSLTSAPSAIAPNGAPRGVPLLAAAVDGLAKKLLDRDLDGVLAPCPAEICVHMHTHMHESET